MATPSAAVGYLSAANVHLPPADLLARDPALRMVRIRSGQTFWGLVREQYGIRAVNKSDAFMVKTDWLDGIGNWLVSGRDASDTRLKANVNRRRRVCSCWACWS